MINLKSFSLFESEEYKTLFDYCERYLSGTRIWDSMKREVEMKSPSVEILEDPELKSLSIDAQFDYSSSTPENLVILVNPGHKGDKEYKSTMAHELTHALQYIRDGYLDLFINDATREFRNISDDPEWEKFMMAVYLVDPLEIESNKSEEKYGKNSFIEEMKIWMKKFNPIEFSNYLESISPDNNEWEMESFNEFPELWSSTYINYEPEILDKEMSDLGNKSLQEFLIYWDKKFKSYSL